MVAVKTGFPSPPMPGMPAPMQPMGGLPPMPPMGGPGSFPQPMGGGNPFAPMPPMPLAGMPPPPPMMQPPMARPPMPQQVPQQQQQGSNAPRRRRFGDSLENMLGGNQGLGAPTPQQRPLPMPPQMMPQQRMVAPGVPMMATPTPRPMNQGGIVQGFAPGGIVQAIMDDYGYSEGDAQAMYDQATGNVSDFIDPSIVEAYNDSLAAVEGDIAERQANIIPDAVAGGILTEEQVQAALDASQANIDAQVAALQAASDGPFVDVVPQEGGIDYTSSEVIDATGGIFGGEPYTTHYGVNHPAYMDALAAAEAALTAPPPEPEAAPVLTDGMGMPLIPIPQPAPAPAPAPVPEPAPAPAPAPTGADAGPGTAVSAPANFGTGVYTPAPVNPSEINPIDYTQLTGDIGNFSGTSENSALYGPTINMPQSVSQYYTSPVTGGLTTTYGPEMVATSPIGAIKLPARPVDIDIFDFLSSPTYGTMYSGSGETRETCAAKGMGYDPISKVCVPASIGLFDNNNSELNTGFLSAPQPMAMGGFVQGFDMGGHAHPHNNNSSIGSSGYTSLDAIANKAVQDDDDKSFTHMGKNYSNVNDYHDAIFGDDDDDNSSSSQNQNTSPNAGDGGGSTTSIGSGSAGSLGGGSTGGDSSSAPPTPVVYRDMYGRKYGSQAEADAANRIIVMQQSDTPDRTIDKAIAGPDLAYDDALSLTQGVLPPQFSGAVTPGSQFSHGNIGGIYANDSDASFGFNLPPAVVEPGVGGTGQNLASLSDNEYLPYLPNIINLDANSTGLPPVPDNNTTSGIQPASNTTTTPPQKYESTASQMIMNQADMTLPDYNTSSGSPSYSTAVVPGSGTTAQNLNQGLGNLKPKPRPTLDNQNTGTKDTTGASQYRPSVNAAEAKYLQNLLGQFEFDENNKMVFAEPNVIEKVMNQIVKNLSLGLIDMEDLDNEKVKSILKAYEDTGTFAYDDGKYLDIGNTPQGNINYQKLLNMSQGDGIEPAVTGIYDDKGNIVSYGPDIKNTKDGPVIVDDVDIFGDDDDDDNDTTSTTVVDTGHTVDDNGNKVCNTEGYVYNPETKICEPAKEEEEVDDVSINIGSGDNNRSFEDVLSNVVIPAPNVAPISANIQPMKMGGMAGLNRAADNFIKALAG